MYLYLFNFFHLAIFLWDYIIVVQIVSGTQLEGRSVQERRQWWGEERPLREKRDKVNNVTPSHDHHAFSKILNLRNTFCQFLILPSFSLPLSPSVFPLSVSLSHKKQKLRSRNEGAEWDRQLEVEGPWACKALGTQRTGKRYRLCGQQSLGPSKPITSSLWGMRETVWCMGHASTFSVCPCSSPSCIKSPANLARSSNGYSMDGGQQPLVVMFGETDTSV